MATNQNEEFVQDFYAWWRTTQQTVLKKFCQNTYNETAIKANFHFPYNKSMENLSCHSNLSNKNNVFVEANATNISKKFQLYRPYSFWGVDFFKYF